MAYGPTGEFPRGKLNDNDQGELIFGVAPYHERRSVLLTFGTPISWAELRPESARELAASLIRAAGEVESAH